MLEISAARWAEGEIKGFANGETVGVVKGNVAAIDAGKGPPGALTTAEREELVQPRRDNKRLEMEREILKKAAAFFAKESQ